jgi:hypothetical protein
MSLHHKSSILVPSRGDVARWHGETMGKGRSTSVAVHAVEAGRAAERRVAHANFKEVRLKHMRIGQPEELMADVYGLGCRPRQGAGLLR